MYLFTGDFDYQKKQISDEPQTCHLAVLYCESKVRYHKTLILDTYCDQIDPNAMNWDDFDT